MGCENCKYKALNGSQYPCTQCSHNYIDKSKPMTNFDRVKAMSVEELATLIKQAMLFECEKYCAFTKYGQCQNFSRKIKCEDGIKKWLESEVKEE